MPRNPRENRAVRSLLKRGPMRLRAALFALPLACALVGSTPARAVVGPSSTVVAHTPRAVGTRIDPAIRDLFGFRARTGKTPLAYRTSDRFERDGVLPVVIRFHAVDDAKLAALGRAGVEWELPLISGAWAAKIDEKALAALEADPAVVSVSCDLPRNSPRPLDLSAKETGIDAARRTLRAKDGTLLDGKGVRIADIDSGVFVFHPAFFRADGGTFAWVDVDEDGALTAGVDGVDLDGDGSVGPNEVLRVLHADVDGRSAGFDPTLDWVYVDENGNGQRDFGAAFAESTPAFGEPIFVIDDADADGKLATSERLLRLGTSKIAAARTTKTYVRGDAAGVLAYGASILKDAQKLEDASHGTGVAGILVGGVPDHSKLLGLAPGADLLVVGYGQRDPSGTVASIQWAINQKADVILTEYAPYTGYPLDGSTEEEALLDSAVDKGIAVVNPAGNLARGYKHRSTKLVAGDNAIALQTDAAFKNSPYVALTILTRNSANLSLKLSLPDGTGIDVPATSTDGPIDAGTGRLLDVVRRDSAKGTHEIHIQLYAYDGTTYGKLPAGKWSLNIGSDAAVDAELFCSDAYNSWAYGFTFDTNTAARTVCHPATNDKGIAVAAYTLHGDDPFGGGVPGTLASYSSMGPRIDGLAGIDLAAPDNPFSTAIVDSPTATAIRYEQFGGTSGAGPHVAAALALLKQHDPTLAGAALQDVLLGKARRDSMVTSDETRWGKGKLDLAAALGIARHEGTPPTVALVAPAEVKIGTKADLQLQIDDDGPSPKVQWDLDYDGTPDTGWEATSIKTITSDVPAVKTVRVTVLDADGYVRGATARVVFSENGPPAPPTPAADSATSDGGCGCHAPARASSTTGVAAALALLAMVMRRRVR